MEPEDVSWSDMKPEDVSWGHVIPENVSVRCIRLANTAQRKIASFFLALCEYCSSFR